MFNLIDEVSAMLRRDHIGGWQDFEPAYRNFCVRHCRVELTEVERMNKFWRHVISNTTTSAYSLSNAMGALCHCLSQKEWLKNFRNYVFVCLTDINEALADYLWDDEDDD